MPKFAHTIQSCDEIARSRGGRLLSDQYTGVHTRYEWECSEGHRWMSSFNHIRQGSWCPHCFGTARKTIAWCHELAARNGGKCLSIEYLGNQKKHEFCCARNHGFWMRPNNIQCGQWCPRCTRGIYGSPEERKIATQLRVNLANTISRNYKTTRKGSAVRDMGCTVAFARTYIESLWRPGMSWANWGKGPGTWQIDHILPLASFDLTKREELLKAVHYTNLQPLWFEENMEKGARLDWSPRPR